MLTSNSRQIAAAWVVLSLVASLSAYGQDAVRVAPEPLVIEINSLPAPQTAEHYALSALLDEHKSVLLRAVSPSRLYSLRGDLRLSLARHADPDIYEMDGAEARDLARRNLLVPLDSRIIRSDGPESNILRPDVYKVIETLGDDLYVNGHIYFLPVRRSVAGLFVRKDAIPAGVDWSSDMGGWMRQLCSKPGSVPALPRDPLTFAVFARAIGGGADPEEACARAAKLWQDCIKSGARVCRPGEALDLLISGEVVAAPGVREDFEKLRRSQKADDQFEFLPFPNQPMLCKFWGISRNALSREGKADRVSACADLILDAVGQFGAEPGTSPYLRYEIHAIRHMARSGWERYFSAGELVAAGVPAVLRQAAGVTGGTNTQDFSRSVMLDSKSVNGFLRPVVLETIVQRLINDSGADMQAVAAAVGRRGRAGEQEGSGRVGLLFILILIVSLFILGIWVSRTKVAQIPSLLRFRFAKVVFCAFIIAVILGAGLVLLTTGLQAQKAGFLAGLPGRVFLPESLGMIRDTLLFVLASAILGAAVPSLLVACVRRTGFWGRILLMPVLLPLCAAGALGAIIFGQCLWVGGDVFSFMPRWAAFAVVSAWSGTGVGLLFLLTQRAGRFREWIMPILLILIVSAISAWQGMGHLLILAGPDSGVQFAGLRMLTLWAGAGRPDEVLLIGIILVTGAMCLGLLFLRNLSGSAQEGEVE